MRKAPAGFPSGRRNIQHTPDEKTAAYTPP